MDGAEFRRGDVCFRPRNRASGAGSRSIPRVRGGTLDWRRGSNASPGFGRPDASLSANGWIAGAGREQRGRCFLKPAAAMIVGGVAGILVVWVADFLEFRFAIDDPGGAVSVHAVGGLWGVLAVALLTDAGPSGQWLAQLVGVATLLGFVLPLTYGLNWLLGRVYRQRVDREGERQGMDLLSWVREPIRSLIFTETNFLQRSTFV